MASVAWLGLIAFALGVSVQRPWTPVATIDGEPVMRGLPKDAIPAIDRPVFVKGTDARFMRGDEYVIGIADDTTAKAYSIWHLNGHEIVNDRLGEAPIAVTWCPLCFTGVVYSRRVEGRTLSFGVSGMLWRENLVMYDRETGSWWAQASGAAIEGSLKGTRLVQLPATMMTWREWLTRHPATLILSKTTLQGSEGLSDVYADYHPSASLGVTGRTRVRDAVDPKTRVAGFRLDDRPFAVKLDALASGQAVVTGVTGEALVIAATRDRAGARVFRAGSHVFTVQRASGETRLVDAATKSIWDPVEGRAVSGPLRGTSLPEIPSNLSYWFAWRAFFPNTTWVVR